MQPGSATEMRGSRSTPPATASPCTRGRTKTRAPPSLILNSSLTVGWALAHPLVSDLRGSVIVEAPETRSRNAGAPGGT